MTCRTCHQPVPDNLISCAYCANKKDELAQRIVQMSFIARAIKGEIEIKIYRSDDMVKHIARWSYETTFCNEPAARSTRLKTRHSYLWIDDSEDLTKLCPKCVAEFNALAEEAGQPPAA